MDGKWKSILNKIKAEEKNQNINKIKQLEN